MAIEVRGVLSRFIPRFRSETARTPTKSSDLNGLEKLLKPYGVSLDSLNPIFNEVITVETKEHGLLIVDPRTRTVIAPLDSYRKKWVSTNMPS